MGTVAIAGLVYIAMAVTSFAFQLAKRFVISLWVELLAVIPAAIALTAAIVSGAAGWIVGLWVFNIAATLWTAWWIGKLRRIEAESKAADRRYIAFLDSYR